MYIRDLTTCVPVLDITERWVDDGGGDCGCLETQVTTVFAKELSDGTNVPYLSHRDDGHGGTNAAGKDTSSADRELLERVICREVVSTGDDKFAEDVVLFRNHDDEEGDPVSEDGKEVGENLRKVLAASDSSNGVDQEHDNTPDSAGYLLEGGVESLGGKGSRVGVGGDVADDAE